MPPSAMKKSIPRSFSTLALFVEQGTRSIFVLWSKTREVYRARDNVKSQSELPSLYGTGTQLLRGREKAIRWLFLCLRAAIFIDIEGFLSLVCTWEIPRLAFNLWQRRKLSMVGERRISLIFRILGNRWKFLTSVWIFDASPFSRPSWLIDIILDITTYYFSHICAIIPKTSVLKHWAIC